MASIANCECLPGRVHHPRISRNQTGDRRPSLQDMLARPTSAGRPHGFSRENIGNHLSMDWFRGKFTGQPHI